MKNYLKQKLAVDGTAVVGGRLRQVGPSVGVSQRHLVQLIDTEFGQTGNFDSANLAEFEGLLLATHDHSEVVHIAIVIRRQVVLASLGKDSEEISFGLKRLDVS